MFYLYLVILALTQYFFFSSLNQIIFNGNYISGDFVFSFICVFFAFLITIGALHTKHINSEKLKILGYLIIALGGIFLLFSLITLDFIKIMKAFEIEIILSISGYLIYYYQTVPEGVPDTEDDLVQNDFNQEYPNLYYDYKLIEEENITDYSDFSEEFDDRIKKPELEQIKGVLQSILEIEELDLKLKDKFNSILKQINQIDNANSEYKIEVISDVDTILKLLLNSIIENNINEIRESNMEESFNLISKNLENIYYNTRGAQVYRSEKELHNLIENYET